MTSTLSSIVSTSTISTTSASPTSVDSEPVPAWISGHSVPLSPLGNLIIQIYFYGVLAIVLCVAFYITIFKTYIRGPKDAKESNYKDTEKNVSDTPDEEMPSTPNSPYESGTGWASSSTVNVGSAPQASTSDKVKAKSFE